MDFIASLIAGLIPQKIKDVSVALIDKIEGLLQGETVLVIGNGAAVVIYLVAKFVKAIPDVSFDEALAQAGAAEVLLNTVLLSIRHYVYSPATVAELTAPVIVNPQTSDPAGIG